MADNGQTQTSFAATLQRIEEIERLVEEALAPAPGWEWWREPTGRVRGIRGQSHVLTLGWPPEAEGGAWTPYLAVYVTQGGENGVAPSDRRAVAFDGDGQRYVLSRCIPGRSEREDSGGWVEARLFHLPPDTLARSDVAFVGIEEKPPPARSTDN
jgi:hypothetical protein